MTERAKLPDARALGLPNIPYSAYCRVCWQSVYGVWTDTNDHEGKCPFGATVISDCGQAMDWERFKGEVKRYLANNPAGGCQ